MTEINSPDRTIALVTGASRGIGREIAGQLAALGSTVLLAARDPERGAAPIMPGDGGQVTTVRLQPASGSAPPGHLAAEVPLPVT